MKPGDRVLALNGGSSSLKFGLYASSDAGPQIVAGGQAQNVGAADGKAGQISIEDANGVSLHGAPEHFPDIESAAQGALQALEPHLEGLTAIAHRIVHGGPAVTAHQRLTPEIRAKLEAAKDFAPLHVPPALAVLDATLERFPSVAQVVCLDTAFHRTLPERARRFALPDDAVAGGVHRYGAHGLSLESAVRLLGPKLKERCVIAHLGGGCSVTAVQDGRSVDTTMGLTPTGGVLMGTRTGDLDPGVLIYLLRHRGYTADTLEDLVDRRSGLLGVSGTSADLRALMESSARDDSAAQLALEMFAYQVAQAIASMAVALGGLDQLVFTGGIGEHAAQTRAEISRALAFLRVALDSEANGRNALYPENIGTKGAAVDVCLVPAREEIRMAEIVDEVL